MKSVTSPPPVRRDWRVAMTVISIRKTQVTNSAKIEAATEIAKDCPIYEYDGSVEVRPIFEQRGA